MKAQLLASLLAVCIFSASTATAAEDSAGPAPDTMRVTLLGTGTPSLSPSRFGNSTLVQAGGMNLVFDAGRGATIRLAQRNVPLGSVDATFITHFHSDHINGLPDLWATSFLQTPQNGRKTPFELYGPVGIATISAGMQEMMELDIATRVKDGEMTRDVTRVNTHTFTAPAVVLEKNGVKVSAFPVDHGEAIKPAVGYKVEYGGHTVVISGDTKYDEELIRASKGADLIVHEVGAISTHHITKPWAKPVAAHHTSPEEAGLVFKKAGVKMAVFSHISRPGPQDETNSDEAIARRAATNWNGTILVGKDLMTFVVGDTVTVERDK